MHKLCNKLTRHSPPPMDAAPTGSACLHFLFIDALPSTARLLGPQCISQRRIVPDQHAGIEKQKRDKQKKKKVKKKRNSRLRSRQMPYKKWRKSGKAAKNETSTDNS